MAQPQRNIVPEAQHQDNQPGNTQEMRPKPQDKMENYIPAGKLKNKIAVVTGGDSGIGRATAIGFAMEGADIAIIYKGTAEEKKDADITRQCIEDQHGRRCLIIAGDIGEESFCKQAVEQVVEKFQRIDILVNNAGEQHDQKKLEDVSNQQLERTFKTNFFGLFNLTRFALPHMQKGSAIINTASITAYQGHEILLDYASTKGAIVAFTRSLAGNVAERGIRVNAVAPGPIWTPLIPSSFSADKVKDFGKSTLMGRPGQPDEVAPCFIFLASDDASYMTGETLHPNGGEYMSS